MSDLAEPVISIPESATCGGCATYAHGWQGRNWKCRRGARDVNPGSDPCSKWRPRKPKPSPDFNAMKDAVEAIDLMLGDLPPFTLERAAPRQRPPGLRGHTGGVVYFIDCGPLTKIGHTGGWIEDRMKAIATSNPFDLTLWGLVKGTMSFEREWHAALEQYRYRNEWFYLTQKARDTIKTVITEYEGELYE